MSHGSLTAEQLAQWSADGFLAIEGFYSDEQCLALRQRALGLIADFDPAEATSVFSTTDKSHAQDQYFLTSGDKIRFFLEDGVVGQDGQLTVPKHQSVNKLGHAMHDLDPVFSDFSRTDELATVVSQLGFAKPQLLQSMYILKPPRVGGEVIWHTDHTFLWTEPQTVVGFWVAIDDATVDNGCMWAVPGGHRLPVKSRFRREGAGTTDEVFDPSEYDTSQKVPLEAKRGTLIALHGTLPHWSGPNTSAMPRHAYTVHIIDGTARYLDDNWLQRSPSMPLRGFDVA